MKSLGDVKQARTVCAEIIGSDYAEHWKGTAFRLEDGAGIRLKAARAIGQRLRVRAPDGELRPAFAFLDKLQYDPPLAQVSVSGKPGDTCWPSGWSVGDVIEFNPMGEM